MVTSSHICVQRISAKLFAFWDHATRLSEQVTQRVKETLSVLYAPEVEDHWLQTSTRLVLALCKRTLDYDVPLFKPLTEASVFSEYRIDLGGLERSVAMTPMFSQSQSMASQADPVDGVDTHMPEISQDVAAVRATNVDPFSQSAYASPALDRDSPIGLSPVGGAAPMSPIRMSGMSRTSAQPLFKKPRNEPPALFNRPVARASDGLMSAAGSQDDGTFRLNRRFVKGNEDEAARKAKQKKKLRQRVELQQRDARAHKVVMYRRYRTGELPDVQIKPKDLLEPLQVLAARDSAVARLLYAIMFLSVLEHASPNDKRVMREEAAQSIERVLRSSRCTAPVIGSLERICFEGECHFSIAVAYTLKLIAILTEPDLVTSAKLIGDVSFRSFNFHSGIMLLEKQILTAAAAEPESSSSKKVCTFLVCMR